MSILFMAGVETLAIVLAADALALATEADGRLDLAVVPGPSVWIPFAPLGCPTEAARSALSPPSTEGGPLLIERKAGTIRFGGLWRPGSPYLPVDSRSLARLDSGLWSDFGTDPCTFTTGLSPLASLALEPPEVVSSTRTDTVSNTGGHFVVRDAAAHSDPSGLRVTVARKLGCLALLMLAGLLVFRRQRVQRYQHSSVPWRTRNLGRPGFRRSLSTAPGAARRTGRSAARSTALVTRSSPA